MDLHLTQPPLPSSDKEGEEEICGSDKWLRSFTTATCKNTKGCWVNVEQSNEGQHDVDGWWPKVRPMKIGMWMEGTDFAISEPEVLSVSES
jgi:hypothetical protein